MLLACAEGALKELELACRRRSSSWLVGARNGQELELVSRRLEILLGWEKPDILYRGPRGLGCSRGSLIGSDPQVKRVLGQLALFLGVGVLLNHLDCVFAHSGAGERSISVSKTGDVMRHVCLHQSQATRTLLDGLVCKPRCNFSK